MSLTLEELRALKPGDHLLDSDGTHLLVLGTPRIPHNRKTVEGAKIRVQPLSPVSVGSPNEPWMRRLPDPSHRTAERVSLWSSAPVSTVKVSPPTVVVTPPTLAVYQDRMYPNKKYW